MQLLRSWGLFSSSGPRDLWAKVVSSSSQILPSSLSVILDSPLPKFFIFLGGEGGLKQFRDILSCEFIDHKVQLMCICTDACGLALINVP